MENLDAEIEKLNKEINSLKNEQSKKGEINKLNKQLNQLKFKKEHPKLLKLTGTLEKGTIGLFKGIGQGLKKAGKTLEKTDEYIAKKQKEERDSIKNKPKQKTAKGDIFQSLHDLD